MWNNTVVSNLAEIATEVRSHQQSLAPSKPVPQGRARGDPLDVDAVVRIL
jgi:hypothetical protein